MRRKDPVFGEPRLVTGTVPSTICLPVTQDSELALQLTGTTVINPLFSSSSSSSHEPSCVQSRMHDFTSRPLYNVLQEHHSIMESVCRYTLSTGMQYGRRVPVLHILQPIYPFNTHLSPWVLFLFFGLSVLCAFTISI